MCTNALSELQPDATTTKRAQYEAFEFDLEAPGLIQIRNGSYSDEADEHTHRVTVENGVPTSCTCKADEYGSGACKHRVAIAIPEPVLAAASASRPDGKRALADGGAVVDSKPQGESAETTHAPGCDSPECEGYTADGRPLLSWECWEVWTSA
ncbi:SWIM zinc finger family protein [Halalkalicoccus ordinarius]|uniref:SWIM zinc finger family protein n=1 Tax=Halalkalicoccus ordinarius TaxID=3116651 RepID=UPI00300EDE24